MPESDRPTQGFKYDVAISCREQDEPIASQLYELLAPRVGSVFLYTKQQKEGIGESGAEWFTGVYSRESRIVVVIYREGWGATKWTGVEDRAIQDVYLDDHRRVLVYSVDGKAPHWLPRHLIYASADYGFDPLVSVIERKVQEEGGEVGPENVLEMGHRVQLQRAAAEARERRRLTTEAVQAALRERQAIYARLKTVVDELNARGASYHLQDGSVKTVSTVQLSMGIYWTGNSVNSIIGSKLEVLLSIRPLSFRGWEERNSRTVDSYELHLAENDTTWQWVHDKTKQRLTSGELADHAMRLLIEEDVRRHEADLERRRR